MLSQRILTALILIPLVIWGVFALSTPWIAAVTAVLALLAAWEWAALSNLRTPGVRGAYMAAVAVAIIAIWTSGLADARTVWHPSLILIPAVSAWGIGMLWMAGRPVEQLRATRHREILTALMGLVVLIPAWLALAVLHSRTGNGPAHLMFLFVLVWGADSGAYFVGKRWGKAKLAPAISPGKTRAGGVGALLTMLLLAVAGGALLGYTGGGWLAFVLVALIAGVFSIYGDLLESVVKRVAGVKDSGQLLPGHGGAMDRIDSITAAAPSFALGLIVMERLL